MNKTVLYYMSLISQILFLVMTSILVPLILKSSWQGLMFLTTVLIYIGIRLFMIVTRKKIVEKVPIYNILTIALTFYLGIIFTRIMLVELSSNVLYDLSMEYCRNNFFLISITMICVILNTIILLFLKEEITVK